MVELGDNRSTDYLPPFTFVLEGMKHFSFSWKLLAHPLTRHLSVRKETHRNKMYNFKELFI
jgi:hypothetical protein